MRFSARTAARHVALVGLGFGLLLSDAGAADVADWATPETELAVIFRGADGLAKLVDDFGQRFAGTPAVDEAVAELRAWKIAGLQPGHRDWGGGLDPAKGIGLFADSSGHLVLVLGITDFEAAKASIAALGLEFELDVVATPQGFEVGGMPLNCGAHGMFMVCDSQSEPAKPTDRPPHLAGDDWLQVFVQGEALRRIADGAPLESVDLRWAAAGPGEKTTKLTVDVNVMPMLRGMLTMFEAGDGPVAGLETVDRRTSGVLKLSIDGPGLVGAAIAQMPATPPPVGNMLRALQQSWSGDLFVSFAGGFAHPVVALGLQPKAESGPIIDAFDQLLDASELETRRQPEGILSIEVGPFDDGDDPEQVTTINLHHGTAGHALVLALAAADIRRCVDGKIHPATLPPSLAAKGRHGLVFWGMPSYFPGGFLPGFLESPPAFEPFDNIQTLLSIQSMLMREAGVAMEVVDTGLRAELWWETL